MDSPQVTGAKKHQGVRPRREHLKRTVLIVEDDLSLEPLWRKVIQDVASDVQVYWATTEEQAEKYIRSKVHNGETFDLIIADIFLSGDRTGLDLWKRYGEVTSNFIVTSGMSEEKATQMLGGLAPLPYYLQKPADLERCRKVIQSAIEPAW